MKRNLFVLYIPALLLVFAVNNSKGQIVHHMYDTLCSGDALFGYNTTGVYRDTFPVAGGDSIRILDLTVIPRIGAAPLPRWFNTGTNGAGGRLPASAQDLRWRVATNINGPYAPAVVMSYVPPNYSASIWPDCAWVSHNAQGSHSGNMFYFYRIDFDLPCFDSCGNSFNADSIFCLMLDILVDNSVYEVFVNNVPQSGSMGGVIPVSNMYNYVGFQTANMLSLSLCKGWKRGHNSLIVQTASGCCNAGLLAQASVNAPPPPPVVNASFGMDPVAGATVSPDTGCAPYTVHFLNSSVAATGFVWDFGDGTPVSTADSPLHTYTAPGTYTVTLIASSTLCGNRSDTVQRVINVFGYPLVDLGPDIVSCDDTILLQSSGSHTGATWLWSDGLTSPSRPVTRSGTYWLVVNRHGCTGRDSVEVMLSPDVRVDLGNDTALCDRDVPLILRASQPSSASLLWSNGLSDTVMSVERTGNYWLHVSLGGCEGSDTIHVSVIPTPVVSLGPDSIICEQSPYRIGTTIPGAAYTWNTGAATSHIAVNETDDYILTVNLEGCIVSDTIHITAMPDPVIDLGGDRDICPEQSIVLDATYGSNSRYLWNTGDTMPAFTATAPGLYTVRVISGYACVGGDTVLLRHYPKPIVMLGADTTVCEETPLVLSPQFINADSLIWSDGSVGNTLAIKYGGTYITTAVNKCGTGADTILVKQIFCDIWIPNAFTPNGDGVNDMFRALGNTGRLEGFRLSVFNRWGQLIFHTKDKYRGWDGSYNGMPVLLGTYVYMLEYSIAGTPYLQKGNFHLIR